MKVPSAFWYENAILAESPDFESIVDSNSYCIAFQPEIASAASAVAFDATATAAFDDEGTSVCATGITVPLASLATT